MYRNTPNRPTPKPQMPGGLSVILNQEEHHSRQTFREEYLEFLKCLDVPYNPKYVFGAEDTTET